MALLNPETAVIAKAKAKYGSKLTDKDYSTLTKAQSVEEVVSYLKSHPRYSVYLEKLSGSDIHRGQVEAMLKEKVFENYLSLCRYMNHSPVSAYIIRQTEMDELMKFITLLSLHKPKDYIFSLPLYFVEHTEIPLNELAFCNDWQDFIRCMEKTDFHRVLSPFTPDENGNYSLTDIEDALENFSLEELYTGINQIKNKKRRSELLTLFDTISDFNNYSRIIRMKKFYHMNAAEIKRHLLPYGNLASKRIDEVLSADDLSELIARLENTPTGRKVKKNNLSVTDRIATKSKYQLAKHNIYFSSDPQVVLMSFLILSNTELNNVVNIIEGVRYKLDQKTIADMLIV